MVSLDNRDCLVLPHNDKSCAVLTISSPPARGAALPSLIVSSRSFISIRNPNPNPKPAPPSNPNPNPNLTPIFSLPIFTRMRTVSPQTLDMAIPFPHLLCYEKPSFPEPQAPAVAAVEPPAATTQDDLKRIAAHRAVELVESGMVLGLGTGSTATHALDRIGELLRSGVLRDIVGIPTSKKTEAHAAAVGIPLSDLHAHPVVDLSIDGADEVDPYLNLVKGRGGSLLREKMIEGASRRFVVIVDKSKMVPRLGGSGLAVPVEVIPFCWGHTLGRLLSLFDGESGFDAM